jgi:hypothetical protein
MPTYAPTSNSISSLNRDLCCEMFLDIHTYSAFHFVQYTVWECQNSAQHRRWAWHDRNFTCVGYTAMHSLPGKWNWNASKAVRQYGLRYPNQCASNASTFLIQISDNMWIVNMWTTNWSTYFESCVSHSIGFRWRAEQSIEIYPLNPTIGTIHWNW